jgi:hypothetical protein
MSSRQTAPRRRASPGARAPRGPASALHGGPGVSARQERWLWGLTLLVAALLGAGLLALVLGPHRIGDYMTETDFYGQYADGARLIQQGHVDPGRYGVVGPGYEVVLALVGLAVRNLFLAAGLLSAGSAVATLLLWAALLRRLAGPRLALGATVFLAANATFLRFSYAVTTDALAMGLQAAALFVLLARPGMRAAAWAGFLTALAFLTRYNAAALVPAGLVAIAAGGTPQERRGRAALLFSAGFLLPVAPWVLYSLGHGGAFSFQLHHNIAYEVFAHARGITWDEYQHTMQPQFHSLADVIARDPAAVAARMLFNVLDHLRQDARSLLGWPVALCAVLGLAVGAADGSLRRLAPLGLVWALLFLSLVPAFYSERYSLALLPCYLAGAALLFASPRFALAVGRTRRVWLKTALTVLPLGFALDASVRTQALVLNQLPVEVLDAARTLRAERRPGDRVIARKGHVAFYAGVGAVSFPFVRTLPELAAYARARGARWLYFSWPEAETRPDFWYLLDTTAVVPGLSARRVTRPHPSVLYEIGPGFGEVPAWMDDGPVRALHDGRGRLLVDPSSVGALMEVGRAANALRLFGEARDALEQLAALQPGNFAAQLALGKACLQAGDVGGGAEAFERAQVLDPTSVEARIGRGWASLMAGRDQEAAALWRPVVALTRDSDTLARMIQLYTALGDDRAVTEARATLAALRSGR